MITIAICTWNRADLLDRTLERMRGLHAPVGVEWELVVVNNACTDHTPAILAKHAEHLPLRAFIEPRPGLSHARNRAVAESRGEILLWTDDDVLVEPNWMVETLNAMQGHHADLSFGKVTPWWETCEPAWFGPSLAGRFALVDYGDDNFVVEGGHQLGFGANHAVRRNVYDKIGAYRTDLGVTQESGGGGEDTEFFKRCSENGLTIVYTGRGQVQHFIPAVRCTKRYFRERRWKGGRDQLRLLRTTKQAAPTVYGMPRYLFSQGVSDLCNYARSILSRDAEEAFYRELRIIGLVSLVRHACAANKVEAADVSST